MDELSSAGKPSIGGACFLAEIGINDETTYCPSVRNVFPVSCASLVAIGAMFLFLLFGVFLSGWVGARQQS
jgi:hypothetical protein